MSTVKNMENISVYERLRRELDKMPVGIPKSRNGTEINILHRLFSPEEARIALYLNINYESLETIYKRIVKDNFEIHLNLLEENLENMAKKGIILKKRNKKQYSYAMFVVGMYEFQVDHMTKDFYIDCEEYLNDTLAEEFFRNKMPQLRTVPIGKSIPSGMSIAIYDDARRTVQKTSGDFLVVNCICRQGKDLLGQHCKKTDLRETCVIFPKVAHHYLNAGTGRTISQQGVLDILQQAEEASLILQMGNAQEDPIAICCCCGDCCAVLSMAKQFSKPAELLSSNYYADINKNECKECKKCISHCHMEAVETIDDHIQINHDRCIGCGVCVPTCPSAAITLIQKKKQYIPPKITADYYKKIFLNKLNFFEIIKIIFKVIFGKKI